MALTGCTKMQRGKRAYRQGEYKRAQSFFEQIIKVDANNMEAQTYLLLTRSGLLTDTAAQLVKQGDFEDAVPFVEQAIVLDPENEDARTVLNTSLVSLESEIEKSFLPNKEWARVVKVADMILKYKPGEKMLLSPRAKAIYMGEKEIFNYKSVIAIKRAFAADPDDAFLNGKMEAINNQGRPFLLFFKEYQSTLLKDNFAQWKNLINPRYLHECEVDVSRLKERGEPVNTVQLYFKELSKLPAKYGNPEGADIVCVEPLSADRAYVHFNYRDLPKLLKMEIVRQGGTFKIDREEDSEIKKTEL
jgi:tetratricopeptide (TPR) repeat protein